MQCVGDSSGPSTVERFPEAWAHSVMLLELQQLESKKWAEKEVARVQRII